MFLLNVYFRMKWKHMGLTGMGHCHSWNLVRTQLMSLKHTQFSVIKRCSGFLVWLIPSLSVIVKGLICTCRLEILSLPVNLNVAKSLTCFIEYNYHNSLLVHLKEGIGYLNLFVTGKVNYFKNSMTNSSACTSNKHTGKQ